MSNCEILLAAILNAGTYDVGTLLTVINNWDLDVEKMVEYARFSFEGLGVNALFDTAYRMHADDVKEWIKDILADLEVEDSDIGIDEDKLEDYEVDIAVNYMATTYDDKYEFWDADNKEELLKRYTKDLVEFLVEEDIVEVKDICEKTCEEQYDPDDVEEEDAYNECVEGCNEYDAMKVYLAKLIKEL